MSTLPPTALEAVTLEAALSSEPFAEAFEAAARRERIRQRTAQIRNDMSPAVFLLCELDALDRGEP